MRTRRPQSDLKLADWQVSRHKKICFSTPLIKQASDRNIETHETKTWHLLFNEIATEVPKGTNILNKSLSILQKVCVFCFKFSVNYMC